MSKEEREKRLKGAPLPSPGYPAWRCLTGPSLPRLPGRTWPLTRMSAARVDEWTITDKKEPRLVRSVGKTISVATG